MLFLTENRRFFILTANLRMLSIAGKLVCGRIVFACRQPPFTVGVTGSLAGHAGLAAAS